MATPFRPLAGTRILSLCLNMPGPAALMRCRGMGATCVKLEPPSGDQTALYNPGAYAQLHEGVTVQQTNLKSEAGQQLLHAELAKAHVLLTSFRPSALAKLGLAWTTVHSRYPTLSQVAIVGAPGEQAEAPGHDLTYLAAHGLVTGSDLPPTLYADMGGSLMATEAVLQAALHHAARGAGPGDTPPEGRYLEVALADAAAYLALPRRWGLTGPGGAVGGTHAGYRIYPCQDGRVAVAALESHFAAALCEAAGLGATEARAMFAPATHEAIGAFMRTRTRAELDRLGQERDIPLHTLA